jgi:hypothetical protein
MASIVYLAKDGTDFVCYCTCENGLITSPAQMDCPWCGCGWLFTCLECRKAFAFARGVEVNESWEELAVRDLTNTGGKKPAPKEVKSWVATMKKLMTHVAVGRRYVYFDGAIIPCDSDRLQFDGRHSLHDLPYVPQVAAINDESVLPEVLTNEEYWQGSKRPWWKFW